MSNEQRKREDENDDLRPTRDNNTGNGGDNMPRFSFTWIYILIGLGLLGLQLSRMFVEPPDIKWPDFEQMALQGDVQKLTVVNLETGRAYIVKDSLYKYFELFGIEDKNGDREPDKPGWGYNPEQMYVQFKIGDMDQLRHNLASLNAKLAKDKKAPVEPSDFIEETNWTGTLMTYLVPLLLLMALWIFILRRMGGGGGGPGAQIFNIGKSKATLFDNNSKVNITFTDVAGLDEAKEEVMEIVDFLKNPKKYTSLGGKIPKGVLLVGPPGTGKTLLPPNGSESASIDFENV